MESLIKSIKKRIDIAKKQRVLGPEDADYQSGYQKALEEILDDLSFTISDLKVDVSGNLQPIERWDGDVIVIAISSLERRLKTDLF